MAYPLGFFCFSICFPLNPGTREEKTLRGSHTAFSDLVSLQAYSLSKFDSRTLYVTTCHKYTKTSCHIIKALQPFLWCLPMAFKINQRPCATNASVVTSNLHETTFFTPLFYCLKLIFTIIELIQGNKKGGSKKVVSWRFDGTTDEGAMSGLEKYRGSLPVATKGCRIKIANCNKSVIKFCAQDIYDKHISLPGPDAVREASPRCQQAYFL